MFQGPEAFLVAHYCVAGFGHNNFYFNFNRWDINLWISFSMMGHQYVLQFQSLGRQFADAALCMFIAQLFGSAAF
jgi:hypothetical protein